MARRIAKGIVYLGESQFAKRFDEVPRLEAEINGYFEAYEKELEAK